MKHFLVDIHYTADADTIQRIRPAHRDFLQTGYDQGLLLMSGPKEPASGGIAIARANSIEDIRAFFAQDPYAQAQAATHTITEFLPVKYAPLASPWINE